MSPRQYRQTARAASVAAMRDAILDAVDVVFLPDPGADFTLEQVAATAETTVPTVLRHFGSKAQLLEAAAQRGLAATQAQRDAVPVGNLRAIARYLSKHYEEVGPMVLRMLAAETNVGGVTELNAAGRTMHRDWVQRVLGDAVGSGTAAERRRRLATLVLVTDVLTWKVLRLEQGLSAADYERCVLELLEAMT